MINTKPLILFDIDSTLFDTPNYIRGHYQDLADALNITPTQAAEAFESYWSNLPGRSDFSPADCIAYLAKYFDQDYDTMEKIFYSPETFGKALFPEVKSVLKKLKKEQRKLGLYSEGFVDFQQRKLAENNILDFFEPDHRYILRRKMDKNVVANFPENTVIIDDKSSVIAFLQKFPNVIPLHIVRNAENLYGEYTLSSLNDLLPILANLSHS